MTIGLSKALVALLLAVLAALTTAVGTGEIGDLSGRAWVEAVGIIVGGTALTAVLENVPGAFGGAIRAVVGGATVALTAWQVAYDNEEPVLHVVTQGEWLTVIIAFVTALSAVYQKTERRTLRLGT